MSTISKKINPFDKPTIWYKFSKMALQTNSANLGQGFPDWKAPDFYYEALKKNIAADNANHQYTRSFGNMKLINAISRNYQQYFQREIDPLNEVLVSTGAVSILYCAITALIEPGDEVVVIEPFYDCYLPQAQFAGGKVIGVPMIPPQRRSRSELVFSYELDEENYDKSGEAAKNPNANVIKDDWKVDFDLLRQKINHKTKLLILNTPNNPTGKILSDAELDEVAKIVQEFPNLYVLSDEVYEHMVFDEYVKLPRFATRLFDRTISIMSAGKIFSATGIRIGWAIGPAKLIKQINSVHQYSSFCLFDPLQNTVADCLDAANNEYKGQKTYYDWLRLHYANRRNFFLSEIIKTDYFKNSNFFVPEGGYFAVVDISNEKVENKNFGFEEDNLTGEADFRFDYTKDFNFLLNMAHERKVVGIPLTPFYTKENRHLGENLVRLAFCKEVKTLVSAFERL